jgi:hypothetical protein
MLKKFDGVVKLEGVDIADVRDEGFRNQYRMKKKEA